MDKMEKMEAENCFHLNAFVIDIILVQPLKNLVFVRTLQLPNELLEFKKV